MNANVNMNLNTTTINENEPIKNLITNISGGQVVQIIEYCNGTIVTKVNGVITKITYPNQDGGQIREGEGKERDTKYPSLESSDNQEEKKKKKEKKEKKEKKKAKKGTCVDQSFTSTETCDQINGNHVVNIGSRFPFRFNF